MAGIEDMEKWACEGGRKIEKIELPTNDPPICDFCSDPNPTHCFITGEAGLGMEDLDAGKRLLLTSDAHWGACDKCAVLVERMDRDAVFERSVTEFKRKHPDEYGPHMTVSLRMIQEAMFWAGFKGERHAASAHWTPEV